MTIIGKPLVFTIGASSGIGATTAKPFHGVCLFVGSTLSRWVVLAFFRICLRWVVAIATLCLLVFQAQATVESRLLSNLLPYSADHLPGSSFTNAHAQAKPDAALREIFRRSFTREPGTSELNEFLHYSKNLSETAHLRINLKEFIFVP